MVLRHGLEMFLVGLLLMGATMTACADEGMWVFNKLPLDSLKAHYGFEPPPGWAEHLRSSAVRFNNGGSGSFVSADGLIMTNHHVGADTLSKLGTKDKDYYRDGFFAKTYDDEAKAPDLELNVLVGIEDVTKRVTADVTAGMDDAAAEKARRKAMAEIEKESTDRTGLRSDVVTLYQGGQYHLYTYKKYTDVRLVFAPEFDVAFFGGDPDNFEYPRYDLDVCFFRAYENGKPARPPHYLKWSKNGTKDGELIFVAGHPGRTDRLNTLASLENLRDNAVPNLLDYLHTKEVFLLEYGKRGAEAFRQSKEDLFGIQNSRKARVGGLGGLRDPSFMARKEQAEKELRSRIAADPKKQEAYGAAWEKIAEAQKAAARLLKPYNFLERGFAFDSQLFPDWACAGAPGRRESQAELGSAQRVSRLRLAIVRAPALLRGAHLPRVRGGKARTGTELLEEEHARPSPGRARLAGPLSGGGRSRSGTRQQACRHRGAQEAGRGGQSRNRAVRRSDDQAGPGR